MRKRLSTASPFPILTRSKNHDPGAYTLLCAQMLVESYIDSDIERQTALHRMYREVAQHHGEPQRLAYAMALEEISVMDSPVSRFANLRGFQDIFPFTHPIDAKIEHRDKLRDELSGVTTYMKGKSDGS